MIRGKQDGKNFSTWFIGFDHELPLPSTKSPVSDKPVTRAASLETLLATSSTKGPRSLDASRSQDKDSKKGPQQKETRDIYQEAFESARRAEENKFKTKFDLLLSDLTTALDRLSPTGIADSFGSTSYGEVMLTFRSRMKELLTGFSQRLQLAYESFDIPHQGETTNQQVRQNVSKMVEGLLGESLDLTSDEAVSDLSSLSDDSGGDQNSFEDQIAQAIVSKLLENHRREVSESLDHPDGPYRGHTYRGHNNDEVDRTSDIVRDFEELRNFVRKTQPRSSPVARDFEEEISPVQEQAIERVALDHSEAAEDFHIRCSSSTRVHNAEPPLPDFSEFDSIDFSSHEIDPDLLSMNLAIIPEETEEELEDEANEAPDKPWRENWIFKGMVSPYDNLGNRRVGNDEGKPLYMMVPQPGDDFVPKVGNRDADQLSDLSDSENPNNSADDLSDDENTFYAKTSEELARISRKHSTASVQTDSDAESGITSRIFTGALRTDNGSFLSPMDPVKSVDSKSGPEPLKLTEDFIPAEGDDPTFILPPESLTVAEGEPVRIICRVGGTSAIDVFWYREHTKVECLEDSEDVDVTTEGDKHSVTIFNIKKEHAGQYMCIALSDQGKCTQYFIVTVTDNKQELKKPEFIKDIQDVDVKEGQSVKFRCKVKGYPQPRVTWYKDGKLIKSSKTCRLEKFGNRDYILTIDNATLDDDAEYSVVAKNIAGEVKSSAQVIVDSDQLDAMMGQSSTATLQQRKNEQNLATLSDKVMSARSNITSTAESMLGTAEEEKAAKNVRMLTSSALNVLRTAEEIIQNEKETPYDNFATSTPRSGTKTDVCNNNIRDDLSTVSTDSFRFVQNCDDSRMESGATSRDIHEDDDDPTDNVKEFSFGQSGSDVSDFLSRKYGLQQGPASPTEEKQNLTDMSTDEANVVSGQKVNFGPKSVDSNRYSRDYEVNSTGRKKWEVKLDSFSPQATIVNRKQTVENTEEQIYMAAGQVYSLEDRVRDLESRVTSDKGQMSDLEDEVAMTVAQIAQSERQIGSIEQTVGQLQDSGEPLSLSPRGDNSSQLSSPRLSVDSGVSSIRERPLQTSLVGTTCEDDVPESRGEYDADSGVELPSVNRLRAMFSKPKEDDLGSGSFTRPDTTDVIHSITARHVPKEQLERLRRTELGSVSPNREAELSALSSASLTLTPQRPQTPQTPKIVHPPQSIQITPSGPVSYKDLEPGKEPVLVYPEPSEVNHVVVKTIKQTASPVQSTPPGSRTRSITPVPQRAEADREFDVRRASSPGPSDDQPKTPRIRSGAISARAAFWEKRISQGGATEDALPEDFPELVQDSDC